MNFIKRILTIIFFFIPISNSFASMVTHVDDQTFQDGTKSFTLNGIEFNSDGTKMFTVYQGDGDIDFINEYDLSTPFDISTHTYAGDSERCNLANGWPGHRKNRSHGRPCYWCAVYLPHSFVVDEQNSRCLHRQARPKNGSLPPT